MSCIYDTAGRSENRRQALGREHDALQQEHSALQRSHTELGVEHAKLQASSNASVELCEIIRNSPRGKADKVVRMVQAGMSKVDILRRIADDGDPCYELSVPARARSPYEFPGLQRNTSSNSDQSGNEEMEDRVLDDVIESSLTLRPLSEVQSAPPPMYLEPSCSTTMCNSRLDQYSRLGTARDSRNLAI